MRFLLRTLSFSYARRHRAKTLLTLAAVIVGVATFAAIQCAKKTLVGGLRGTVDRMAGKAQLQIHSDAGVPEELQEKIRDIPGIRAQSPVIEQLVVPERGELGTLLVLGVDLLGDREMRDYDFSGEDADLDDPLLFLAQADSVALSKSFARRAGLRPGDRFSFRAPQGMKTVIVRGLLDTKGFAEAFGGNIAVMDVYAAQDLFGRGRRFDRIEVRLEPGTTLEEGTAALLRGAGSGFRIETPGRRGEQLERLISSFTAGFSITSGFALGIGMFLIFNAFSVSVQRRRRDIGTLRALGATPRQVQGLFLLEAVVIGVIGGAAGLAAGGALANASLRVMGDAVTKIYGLRDASTASLDWIVSAESILLGIGASVVGAWAPARAAARVRPTEALAKGTYQARVRRPSWKRVSAGLLSLAVAITLAVTRCLPGIALFFTVLGFGLLAAFLATGPLASLLIRLLTPLLSRLSPVAGRLAADSLASNPRRTSGTVTAMTISLAFVLGTGGYMNSTRATLIHWMDDILTADLYVRASANLTRPDARFPGSLGSEIRSIPGVKAVESFRGARIPYGGDEILLMTIEVGPMMNRSRRDFFQGSEETMRQGVVYEKKCAVSENFFRRFHRGAGDVFELSTPAGVRKIPIVAVFRDYSSDKGSVFIDRSYFLELWGDDRVDTFDVSIDPGVDPGTIRQAVREKIGGRMPALISSKAEFTAEIGKAIDAFYVLTRVTLLLALVVAFLGIVSSLLISVVERTREIGILKALGAVGSQIARSVVIEALTVAIVALILAIPLGALDSRFGETTVAEVFAGFRMTHEFSLEILVELVVALPIVSILAAWLPARGAARIPVTEAIEYE